MVRRWLLAGLSIVSLLVTARLASAQPGPRLPHEDSEQDDPLRETVDSDEAAIPENVPPVDGEREQDVDEDEEHREPCEAWCGRYPSFEEKPRVIIGLDLLPEIGTSAGYEDNHVRHLSLNLIGGYSGGTEGLELSGAFVFTTSHVYGVQLGGLLNLAGGHLYGVQIAGLLNAAASNPYGLQLAGGMNVAGGVPRGLQLAGGVNFANDGVYGVQLAGGANLAGGLDGAQLGGVLNIVDHRHATGAQLAAVNITSNGLEGAQLGAVNVTGPGKTNIQVGVINVAEQSDFSLGLVNVLYGGRTHVDVWFAETGFAHAGLKHGGRWFHNIYAVGFRNRGGPQASLAFGIGAHIPLLDPVHIDVDALGHAIVPAHDDGDEVPLLGSLRVLTNTRLSSTVSLLAGLSYNVLWTAETDRGQSYPLFADHELDATADATVLGWPGFTLGLQFLDDTVEPIDDPYR